MSVSVVHAYLPVVHKKRSSALGIFAVRSSIGGTILPIAMQQLLNIFGFRWSMRIMASILGFAVLMSNLVRLVLVSSLY